MPANANLHEDKTLFYVKTPQEMSRYEIAELEKMIRDMNKATEDDTVDDDSVESWRGKP